MPVIVRDVGTLNTTSTSATVTTVLGHLDDANSLTVFFASSAGALTSGTIIQISQFDPADPFPVAGVTQSSNFFNVSSSNVYSSGSAVVLANISFRGIRMSISVGTSVAGNTANEPIAFVTKNITV